MCGIVGAIANRDITPVLLDGLQRLEYRGYDSAGLVVLNNEGQLCRERSIDRVTSLSELVENNGVKGHIGIAHTRWATHGKPAIHNAHPHISKNKVSVVHNGIIENHDILRTQQKQAGYTFSSETDTEVIVHQIESHLGSSQSFVEAVQKTTEELEGAFALGVISTTEPDTLVVARRGSPLVIGFGTNETFIASDMSAIVSVVQEYCVLEDGDTAAISTNSVTIYDENGVQVDRKKLISSLNAGAVELGEYRYYMEKEIHEQTRSVTETLEGRIGNDSVLELAFGPDTRPILDAVEEIKFVACGTSFNAACIARYWFEQFGYKTDAEVASEFRYRTPVVNPNTLFITISQSGETADTLAALSIAKDLGFAHTLCICNVPESSLVRQSDLAIMTHAGPEIGVASTKAFTTQLTALLMLGIALRRRKFDDDQQTLLVNELRTLPSKIEQALQLESEVQKIAPLFADKEHALFLGRGTHYPIAMEGALKLKEISYIHAEAYAAGELKHGPLALVDKNMPVVVVAPNNRLLEKLKSNIEEVRARGGKMIVFADPALGLKTNFDDDDLVVINVAPVNNFIAPIIFTIPLQLLAFHVALIKGTDVDKPRNLAKSVTVE
ncbi:MAG: glutamine--fructose-6-phosphate transaminase (isomerizing) [Arenicella sp.]